MAKISDAKVKSSSKGYNRVFDNDDMGLLMSKVQSTVISNGAELEKIILEKTNNIRDLNQFIEDFKTHKIQDGIYVCTKRVLKKSQYQIGGNEPDLLVLDVPNTVCHVIELKDGDSFDTKKAKGEREHLEEFCQHIGSKIPFCSDYFVCCFNQLDKGEIVKGFKNAFDIENTMTGPELCALLGISYEAIVQDRKKDAKENIEYFYREIMNIPEIKEMLQENDF